MVLIALAFIALVGVAILEVVRHEEDAEFYDVLLIAGAAAIYITVMSAHT